MLRPISFRKALTACHDNSSETHVGQCHHNSKRLCGNVCEHLIRKPNSNTKALTAWQQCSNRKARTTSDEKQQVAVRQQLIKC